MILLNGFASPDKRLFTQTDSERKSKGPAPIGEDGAVLDGEVVGGEPLVVPPRRLCLGGQHLQHRVQVPRALGPGGRGGGGGGLVQNRISPPPGAGPWSLGSRAIRGGGRVAQNK